MNISVQLSEEERRRLEQEARRLNVSPEELARVALHEFLAQDEEEFGRIAAQVLKKNAELYRRLA